MRGESRRSTSTLIDLRLAVAELGIFRLKDGSKQEESDEGRDNAG